MYNLIQIVWTIDSYLYTKQTYLIFIIDFTDFFFFLYLTHTKFKYLHCIPDYS